jgi:hypothetical protein
MELKFAAAGDVGTGSRFISFLAEGLAHLPGQTPSALIVVIAGSATVDFFNFAFVSSTGCEHC